VCVCVCVCVRVQCRQLYFWMHAVVIMVIVWLLVAPPVRATVDKPKQS